MPHSIRLLTAVASGLLILTSCTDSPPPAAPAPTSPSSVSSSPATRELTDKQRAAQLTALAPEVFDATYRLVTRGKRPNAQVRMRARGDRFRLDLARHRATAVLITAPRGVVSCQAEENGKGNKDRSCFLVSRNLKNLPTLFDPRVQRLFGSTSARISRHSKDLSIKAAHSWQAPKGYGKAECFDVRGEGVSRGTYCYLAKQGPLIGLLARVKFPSGTLSLRSVNRVIRKGAFKPPARPTPLPN